MHALTWIAAEGKYLRRINSDTLRKALDRKWRECTWCGKPVRSPMLKYCSTECKAETEARMLNPSYALRRRDQGICALCGLDTYVLFTRVNDLIKRAVKHKRCYSWKRLRRISKRYGLDGRHPFDVDHVLPVSEGGGLCGLEGLRTLCKPCHKTETAKLASRRSKVKRA